MYVSIIYKNFKNEQNKSLLLKYEVPKVKANLAWKTVKMFW